VPPAVAGAEGVHGRLCEELRDEAISPLHISPTPRRHSEHHEESEKLNPTPAAALRSRYSTSPTLGEVAESSEAGGVVPHYVQIRPYYVQIAPQ
jgi:hypothetical protein